MSWLSSRSRDLVDFSMPIVGQVPAPKKFRSALTVAQVETTLEEWFGRPVVLTSSGRGALILAFSHLGLNRYRDRIAMTPMISTCVMDAVVRHAFPVDAASASEVAATLVYHQYGFIQTIKPTGPVVEDICHSFYATPTEGRRDWFGALAAFSLPKFFSTSSPVGGLVVQDRKRAESLRALRDAQPQRSIEQQDEESRIYCDSSAHSHFDFVRLYLSRLVNAQIADRELGGLPKQLSEIVDQGLRRKEIIAAYSDAVGRHACPPGWHEMMLERLPYFFPVSGEETRLLDARSRLQEIGVEADLYSIDAARNMTAPNYIRMLLLPCHDKIPQDVLAEAAAILRTFRACRSVA
jgi:putative PLP-dependent aminotransferase (TIGR04422 family)